MISLDHEPIGIAFDKQGNLWISAKDPLHPLLFISKNSGFSIVSNHSSIDVLQNIVSLSNKNPATENAQTEIDIYEISKMRKWSQWKPSNFDADCKKKRSREDSIENEAVIEKIIKF